MARILIAEPISAIRELIAHVVRELGHTPFVASDTCDGEPYDVLVVELAWLPGRELAARLRRERGSLAIVCVSSRWLPDIARQLDPSAYLMKPFRLEGLQRALARAVAESEAS